MSPESFKDLEIWAKIIQGLSAPFTAAITAGIALFLFRASRRRERFERHKMAWQYQQALNEKTLGDDKLLVELESLIYGKAPIDIATSRKRFILFLRINIIQDIWYERKERLISKKEFKERVVSHWRLIAREAETIKDIFTHRGYRPSFKNDVLPLLEEAVKRGAPALPVDMIPGSVLPVSLTSLPTPTTQPSAIATQVSAGRGVTVILWCSGVLGSLAVVLGALGYLAPPRILIAVGILFLAVPLTSTVSANLHRVLEALKKAEEPNPRSDTRVPWIPLLIGITERAVVLVIIAWDVSGAAGFMSTWIAVKTAGGWQAWSSGTTYGRSKLFAGLIGSLVSMAFAIIPALLVRSVLRR